MAATPHISLAAETLFHVGSLTVTNSLITTWILMLLIVATSIAVAHARPNSKISLTSEWGITTLRSLFTGAPYFTILATLFIFILVSNWSGLIPGLSAIELHNNHTALPLLRAPTTDINTTIALAAIAMVAIQYFGISQLKLGYFKKFFNFHGPINFFVGLLELVSEASRLISFAFRLFGNIFAGEVLLTVMAFLLPIALPIPFLGLEIFVGFIQAMVFSLLTASFLKLAAFHH